MSLKNVFKSFSLAGIFDFTATTCAALLPFILIAAVWVGLDAVLNVLLTDVILLASSVVGYKLINRS